MKNWQLGHKAMRLGMPLKIQNSLAGLAVGLVGIALAFLRTHNEEADLLIGLVNPGELFALVRNPELAQYGFPSSAEITAQSLPLRMYQLLAYSPIDLSVAFRLVALSEIIFFAVCIWCAVMVLHPRVSRTVVGLVVLIGLQGTILFHNLAHFGFMFGWNYGFATGVLLLILAFGLRGKWPQAVMAVAVLLTIHPTLAVHGVLALGPVAILEKAWKNREILSLKVISVVSFCITYVFVSRSSQDMSVAQLDSRTYVQLIRVFQYHLFYDFELQSLAAFSKDFAGWSVALGVLIHVIAHWRVNRTIIVPTYVQYIQMIWIFSFSIFGWWHSQLELPNTTVLLLAPHRISISVVLLFLIIAIPWLVNQTGSYLNTTVALLAIMWALVPDQASQALIGLVTLSVLTTCWIWGASQFTVVQRACGLSVCMIGAILQISSLRQVAWRLPQVHWLALAAVVCGLVMIGLLNLKRVQPTRLIRITPLFSVVIALALSSQMSVQSRSPLDTKVEDLTRVAEWARDQTSKDSVFLLPPEDFGFGWRAVSERATVGLPREWLHYSFLYLQDQDRMMLGLMTAQKFGVDAAAWTFQNQALFSGSDLVQQIYLRYQAFSDDDLVSIAASLGATYMVLKVDWTDWTPCFRTVFTTQTYQVAIPESCSWRSAP